MKECREFIWTQAYEIGHQKIDNEHKKLFELANDILHLDGNQDKIKLAIKELIKYTKFHFFNEENYMKSVEYDKIHEHQQMHKNIVDLLNELIDDLDYLPQQEISRQLNIFVNQYIVQHILIEDKKVHHFRRNRDELKDMFEWKDVYKINHNLIDTEHIHLFEIAFKALENCDSQDIKSHVRNIIIELYDYMKIHFEHEENFMKEIGYIDFDEHKMIHENIIIQINDFIKQISTLSLEEFERKLIEYIDIWLVNHIVYEDRKIACFMKKNQK
ncbi:bacteriohemerythrin [Arcobacter sp. FWKO B]|uniref:bacteriohemerythrin n=1 Tax=Arcobacter sp. FWKO B TaxID=2593672 RepID=UPI0018A55AE8|nr:hemerythrin family protein [Arcobacter sp. FWKO B]QOG12966.1 hypothetical protein FWKOB_09830 [Arcobacter sp. FWKO B]